jgi:hypothetical protein
MDRLRIFIREKRTAPPLAWCDGILSSKINTKSRPLFRASGRHRPVTEISQRNAHAAYRLLKTLKTFFRWCVGRAVIDFSPADGVQSNWLDVSRDRVLTDQELAAVILGAQQMPWPYGALWNFWR